MGEKQIEAVQNWMVTNGADFVLNLVVFILILIVGKFVVGGLCSALNKALDKTDRVSGLIQGLTINVTHKILWVIVIMVGLQRLGINIAPLIAGLGVTGFIVGFAFQESLGNFAAGLMIALNEPFKIGDFVDAGGTTGVVKDMNMMAVTLSTPDNKKVLIPNAKVWGSCITNYTAHDQRRVDLSMGISYGSDIGKARQVALDVCAKCDLVLDDPGTVVEVVEMADSSVNFVVRPWCNTADYWTTFFAVSRGLKEGLDAAGIEIPFPQRDVHMIKDDAPSAGA